MSGRKLFIFLICFLLSLSACDLAFLDEDTLQENLKSVNSFDEALPQTAAANTIMTFLKSENSSGKSRKVLFLGYDGVRADALAAAEKTAVDEISSAGGLYIAWTGGGNGEAPYQRTDSGPGWATLLTGVWADKHGFVSNGTEAKNSAAPSFLKQAEQLNSDYVTASFVNWATINKNILQDEYESVIDLHQEGISDEEVRAAAIEAVTDQNADVTFVAFDDPDYAGHNYGFNPAVKSYTDQITLTDSYAMEIINAVKGRSGYADEDWLIVIATDHGGMGTGHGGKTAGERTIWIALNQPDYLTR